MNLPIRFLQFWYPDALSVSLRILKNSILVIEEDLAVGLMWKLLFTPLFHDNTFVGRVVSFFFRLSRVLMGIFAYFLLILFIFSLYAIWFLLPIGIILCLIIPNLHFLLWLQILVFIFGVALFIDKLVINEPHKKSWQVKDAKDIWSATKLKPKDIACETLLQHPEVHNLLSNLELGTTNLLFCPPTHITSTEVLEQALKLAQQNQAKYLTPAYFFVADIFGKPGIDREFLKYNLTKEDFINALKFLEEKRRHWRKVFIWDEDFEVKHLKGINRGWLGRPTPTLNLYSRDLTKIAASIGFPEFIGRDGIVSEVVTVLSQSQDRNVLLVGPAGSGRSALVQYLSEMIIAGNAPPSLSTKRIVELDLAGLLSGISNEGELATKVQAIFSEVSNSGNIIVFIDEIHSLGTGEAGKTFNLYSLIQPYIESNAFQFIGATEQENYSRILEKNSSFARIFHKIELPVATIPDTIQILQNRSIEYLRNKKLFVTYRAIKGIAEMSGKLIHDLVLPDSALSILHECEAKSVNGIIDLKIVKEVFEKRVNVPVIELDPSQKENLLNLEGIIHMRMIDQEEAVKKVADTLRRGATALKDVERPIGSFLFVGPTGVGKTELAKILAEVYFKNQGAFIRFDMSEFQTETAVDRLIGTMDTPGELTETVNNKPYSLLLLDEFEKADPKILTLFLQVLEDGRLTDATGKTTDFTNTIIIATSNAASLKIAGGLKMHENPITLEKEVKDELLKIYKPELLNRFDEVVLFKPLSRDDLEKVVKIKLDMLKNTLNKQGYLVDFSPEVTTELSKKGFDSVLGARPLRRLIQDTLESKLSKMILQGKLIKGEAFMADASLIIEP